MKSIRYEFELTLTEPILGSLPADPEILDRWVHEKARKIQLAEEKLREELAALPEGELQEDLAKQKVTCFARDHGGELMVWDYVLKGFLKESGNVQKDALDIKALRSKIDATVFVKPRRLHLLREGEPITEPDDVYVRPLRAMTAQGPRVSLASSEMVNLPVSVVGTVDVLGTQKNGGCIVTEVVLRELLEYGVYHGIGQNANGGFGRFEFSLTEQDEDDGVVVTVG